MFAALYKKYTFFKQTLSFDPHLEKEAWISGQKTTQKKGFVKKQKIK